MLPPQVIEQLTRLPNAPGVYLFKDQTGQIVYVGKGNNLRTRVRSYFQERSSDTRAFIPFLHKVIGDLEWVVTQSEEAALLLENELIKAHQPRYNVKLRDDRYYLSMRLTLHQAWPRLTLVRRTEPDAARYFGPYPASGVARRLFHLANKYFLLRTCSDTEMAARTRPCLQYQMKRCLAPCVLEVDRQEYQEQVKAVSLFLEGKHEALAAELTTRMTHSAAEMDFERAAVYRDQLRALEKGAAAYDNAALPPLLRQPTEEQIFAALEELKIRLQLPKMPRRIECCDISHLGGEDTVGAVVAMRDGTLEKSRYRTFVVRGSNSTGRGGDDYGAMYEVLARRLRRGLAASEAWSLPDLLVVDGGKGQLAVALAVVRDLELSLPCIGLAKEREHPTGHKNPERVYCPGETTPRILTPHAQSTRLLCRLRDEAHRVSNRARIRLTRNRMRSPSL